MVELFEDIGVEVTKENQNEINKIFHDMLSVDYENSPATWKLIRKRLVEDGDGFKKRIQAALSEYRKKPV